MNDWIELTGGFFAGAAAAAFFVASLWWTTIRLPASRQPWLLHTGSAFLRMAVVIATFGLLARGGDWRILVAAAIGFALIRTVGVCTIAHRDANFQLVPVHNSSSKTLPPRSKP
ncbi:MAG: ATP synthase subunit I [Rhodopirellula sp. JB055]|uniref:N-ATPase subunit AtpR n=1 Tax=Rhodopirellula sp. JB055 TaxID=3342846 RepID=UPI00370B8D1F